MSTLPPRRIALLGATGSVGRNALDVVANLPGRFAIAALTAGDNIELLAAQALQFRPALLAVRTGSGAEALRLRLQAETGGRYRPEIMSGPQGLLAAAVQSGADTVLAATVGVAGLAAIEASLRAGLRVALANKEALVVAGALLLEAARTPGAAIVPVDSEHSAIHQCLRSGSLQEVRRLILTASGGPFRGATAAEMAKANPAQALQHPTWSMGARISLDSATMMNKGFEILEACHLFGVSEERVAIVVHPQCIVHSMVEFADGSLIAQMGTVDMRTPIQYALTWPDRLPSPRTPLKLEEVGRLDFQAPDVEKFPCLGLARQVWRAGGGAGAVLNAADEVALEAFVAGQIDFPAIARVVEETLQQTAAAPVSNLDDVLELDRQARRTAQAALAVVRT